MRAIVIRENRGDGWPRIEETEVDEDRMAPVIGADYFEIYTRRVGSNLRPYVIVCDEEGRTKRRAPTAYCRDTCGRCYVQFCGDIIVTKTDGRGDNLADLEPKDIAYLKESIGILEYAGRLSPMLEIVR